MDIWYGCVCINYEDVYFFMNGYFVNGGTNSLDDQNGTNYHSHSDIRDFSFHTGSIKLAPVGQFQYLNYWTIQIVMFVIGEALHLLHSLIWRENRYKKLGYFVRYM